MMQGWIENGRHPRLMVILHSKVGAVELKALVDSGFDGQLALPYFVADQLQLNVLRLTEVTYADGQKIEEIVCMGEILWDNEVRLVEVVLSEDDEPAIGTGLLSGCVLTMDFIHDTLIIEKPEKGIFS